jgi:CheY-like chemotaxis protein
MTAEVRERAFDPFFTTKGAEGLGLGLAMVHGFARQSGGDARIFSTPGEGTIVELWLPAAAAPGDATPQQGPVAAPPDAPADAHPQHPAARSRILVVDDQQAVLDVVSNVLRQAGYDVLAAGGGEAALALVAAGAEVDAMVTDYTMPGLSGIDVVRELRRLRPGTPSLIITGFAGIADFDPDAHDCVIIGKPFRRDALLAALRRLLQRRAAAEPVRG